jgi:hypothetical protein
MTGPLAVLLAAAASRCAHGWARDAGAAFVCHTCTAAPGHDGDHVCACGARLAVAGAA